MVAIVTFNQFVNVLTAQETLFSKTQHGVME